MWIEINPIEPADIPAIHQAVEDLWGSHVIVVHLEQYNCDDLPGFAAFIEGDLAGFLHYEIRDAVCEVMTLASLTDTRGIGTALMSAAERIAAENHCTLLQVTTTNDNLHAIAFYQHRGFRIKEVFPRRIEQARKIKPSIPLIGENGIPIEDEILLEKEL
ncbi:MAG: GNAT family N-acetyltransferase [Anaerolineaceae bacterium]|nr:GNAT family N-acetyltransferase [Anaerolineaceae bacterium]